MKRPNISSAPVSFAYTRLNFGKESRLFALLAKKQKTCTTNLANWDVNSEVDRKRLASTRPLVNLAEFHWGGAPGS